MLYVLVLIVFAVAAMSAAGLLHSARGWWWAMTIATAAALCLIAWTSVGLRSLSEFLGIGITPGTALISAALPPALVLIRLGLQRQNTPRHIRTPEDDPVYRRYLEEKRRRHRLRRQQDEALEQSDEPLGF